MRVPLDSTPTPAPVTPLESEQVYANVPPVLTNMPGMIHPSYLARTIPRTYRRLRWIDDVSEWTQATADVNGVGELRFGPVPMRERWKVDRIVARVDPVVNPNPDLGIYSGTSLIGDRPEDTQDYAIANGNRNITADVIHMGAGHWLRLRWTGLTASVSVVTARIHRDVYVMEMVEDIAGSQDREPTE